MFEPGTTADPGVFTFHRTGPLDISLDVDFRISGTATIGQDYMPFLQGQDATISFPVGVADVSFTLDPVNDNQTVEPDETVIATILPRTGGGYGDATQGYHVGAPASATVNLLDAEVVDYIMEWYVDDSFWEPVPASDLITPADRLRWTPVFGPNQPPLDLINELDWAKQPWSTYSQGGDWEVFASRVGYGITEGNFGSGDWDISPFVYYQGGAVDYMASPKVETARAITSATWEGIVGDDGEDNLIPGPHYKFYAERNLPADRPGSELHNQVWVNITLDRPLAVGDDKEVWTKLFDPDNYSSDPAFDPNNIPLGHDDNYDANGQTGMGAHTSPIVVKFVIGQSTNGTVFTVTGRHPTNNYILAADDRPLIGTIKFDTNDDVTLKRGDGLLPSANQTPMLDIWRTLYAEIDRMGPIDYTAGNDPSQIAAGNVRFVSGNDIGINWALPDHQFQGGTIRLFDAQGNELSQWPFDVVDNTTGLDGLTIITLDGAAPTNATTFQLLNDDDVAHGVTVDDMTIDASLWASRFAPAYITVNLTKHDLAAGDDSNVNDTAVPFELNTNTASRKDSISEADFWIAYQLGAFQPLVAKDGDPDSEYPTFIGWAIGGVSFVYRETLRDGQWTHALHLTEQQRAAVFSVHEAGHEFGLVDGPLGNAMHGILYDYNAIEDATSVDDLQINGAGYRVIIKATGPGL